MDEKSGTSKDAADELFKGRIPTHPITCSDDI